MATVDARRDDPFVILLLIGPETLHPDETDGGGEGGSVFIHQGRLKVGILVPS